MTGSNALVDQLLDAAQTNVVFDGWSEETFRSAAQDAGIDLDLAHSICPRGAVDLALAYHKRGDDQMAQALIEANLTEMRIRERVTFAVRARLDCVDRELVRRGVALFSLPHYAGDGTKAIWGTADRIWIALGDSSDDVNWYTKRATLAAVYASVVLYWLGDDSEGSAKTWEFLDRRIENVMQIEKVKAGLRKTPILGGLLAIGEKVKAPVRRDDVPGGSAF